MKLSHFFSLFLSAVLTAAVFFTMFVVSDVGVPTMKRGEAVSRIGRTLVLDPGHGGADGGAVSVTGTPESVINLAVALKAEQLAAFFGVVPVMTRRSEELDYPQEAVTIRAKKIADQKGRVSLISSIPDALVVSIHQNKYTSASPSGAQVFFAENDGGRELADKLQESLLSALGSGNRSAAKRIPESIYLMNAIDCPAVLVECGFLSNPREAKLLEDDSYQTKLAAIIIGATLNYYNN